MNSSILRISLAILGISAGVVLTSKPAAATTCSNLNCYMSDPVDGTMWNFSGVTCTDGAWSGCGTDIYGKQECGSSFEPDSYRAIGQWCVSGSGGSNGSGGSGGSNGNNSNNATNGGGCSGQASYTDPHCTTNHSSGNNW